MQPTKSIQEMTPAERLQSILNFNVEEKRIVYPESAIKQGEQIVLGPSAAADAHT
jgi:hypothetical protein